MKMSALLRSVSVHLSSWPKRTWWTEVKLPPCSLTKKRQNLSWTKSRECWQRGGHTETEGGGRTDRRQTGFLWHFYWTEQKNCLLISGWIAGSSPLISNEDKTRNGHCFRGDLVVSSWHLNLCWNHSRATDWTVARMSHEVCSQHCDSIFQTL